jgi:von Willebrand factor type A domain
VYAQSTRLAGQDNVKMGLEATMIMYAFFYYEKVFNSYSVDNSEHTRNGDFTPTRFGAQSDAVNMIFTSKINANGESTVGLMTLAGAMYRL